MLFFGKTMENIKNRINIHATTSEQNAVKWFSKVHMKGAKYFSGLYLIEMYKEEVLYDKPLCWSQHFGPEYLVYDGIPLRCR